MRGVTQLAVKVYAICFCCCFPFSAASFTLLFMNFVCYFFALLHSEVFSSCCATLCVSFWPQKVFWPAFTFISGFGQFVVAQGQVGEAAGKGNWVPFVGCGGACLCVCLCPRGCGELWWCTSLPVKAVYAVACYHLWLTHLCSEFLLPSSSAVDYISIVISQTQWSFINWMVY